MPEKFEELLKWLREQKPNDRSDQDRYYAIVITDVEKAAAVFTTLCETSAGEEIICLTEPQ
jgi:hypothetical protein